MSSRPTIEKRKPDTICDVAITGRMPRIRDEGARRQVLLDIFGADVGPELIDFAASAGRDPHLLAELALGLAEEGLVEERNGVVRLTVRRIPRRVITAVSRELGELSAVCQQFLKVAAVLGRSFMLEDVSRMLDQSSASLLAPLDEALVSGFVIEAEYQLAFQSEFHFRGGFESIPASARGALQREALGLPGKRIQESDERFGVTVRPAEPYCVAEE